MTTNTVTEQDRPLRYTSLVKLAREMGADRLSIPLVESTNEPYSDDDEADDLIKLREQFARCRYAPSHFGFDLLILNYRFGRGDFTTFTFNN